eukprot:scaffold918_cov126-Cylindrotheca_fusiformis.AAC.29
MKLSKRFAVPIFQALTFQSHKLPITTTALANPMPPSNNDGYRSSSSTAEPNTLSSTGAVCESPSSFLERARNLKVPSREQVLRRDRSVYTFWDDNDKLLEQAWKEWQASDQVARSLPKLDSSLIHPELRRAVEQIWESVESGDIDQVRIQEEILLKKESLFQEVAPGVFAVQFLDVDKIYIIRKWFDAAANSGIPIRPPYGIVLNRKGFMIDSRSVGYWSAPDFQSFYTDILINSYIRPLSRLFFSDTITKVEDDLESFAFSIQYQVGGDESIRHHTDASTITFNINLDESRTWTGSSLYFWEHLNDGKRYIVDWAPGMAMMHRGRTLHAALPIESGIRNNLVVWTIPKDGVGRGYGIPLTTEHNGEHSAETPLTMSWEERWSKPTGPREKPLNRWTPF